MRNFISISDLHFDPDNKTREEIFRAFLNHPLINAPETDLVFLGDIFELQVGGHSGYLKKHHLFFQKLKEWEQQNKRVYFVEGNHDFASKKLFSHLTNVTYITHHHIIMWHDKRLAILHGDRLFDHESRYNRIIRSSFMRRLINIVPFSVINFVANAIRFFAGTHRYDWSEEKKLRFQTHYIQHILQFKEQNQLEIILCGHSHFIFTEEGIYNSGACFEERAFLYGHDGLITIEKF